MARIFLVSADSIVLTGFRHVLAAEPDMTVEAVHTGVTGLLADPGVRPGDVAVIDHDCLDGGGQLREIRQALPHTRIVLWVHGIRVEQAYRAMQSGVEAILRRALSPELQVKCLRKVAQGELWFERELLQQFVGMRMNRLTPREEQLVALLARGLKNKEIAERLFLSTGTVKVYLSRLYKKLGFKDRFELALYGLNHLLSPGEKTLGITDLTQELRAEAGKVTLSQPARGSR